MTAASPEQMIVVITKLDPLPLSVSQSIQQIFGKMSRMLGHDLDTFFKTISQSECNNRLVNVSTTVQQVAISFFKLTVFS